MNPNQKEIAAKLGVSTSLVSRVLSGRAAEIGIAQATIDKVVNAAKEMGYVPNVAAQSLKGIASNTLGVVVYDFNDPFFGTVIHHLQSLAHAKGYSLLLVGFQNRHPDKIDLQPLNKFSLDGIIIVGSDFKETWVEDFAHLPSSRIGRGSDQSPSLKITADARSGYNEMVEHLKSLQTKSAAFLGYDRGSHRDRAELFAAAAQDLDTSTHFDSNTENSSFEVGHSLTAKLIKSGLPQALVCANDQVAMGAIHEATRHGINAPKDLKVIGYDDTPSAAQFLPALSTIRQPIDKIAQMAFDAVISKNCPNDTIFIPSQFIKRTSA